MNADGSGQRRLTRAPGTTSIRVVARRAKDRLRGDRDRLGSRRCNAEIYVVNVDGSRPAEPDT